MGHLAKTVKQAQIMGAFEDFGLVKSVDVCCLKKLIVCDDDMLSVWHFLDEL